jgi:nucleoside-diphosphate-sugar epimerase
MTLTITGARLELAGVLKQSEARRPGAEVHINLSGQQANTLLHDGHAWKDFPRTVLGATRRALRAAGTAKASMLVHASFAFIRAVEGGPGIGPPLQSCVDAILECEALVLASALPACVVRLGYLYGPDSADLRAYRTAFRLARPYWSGKADALQDHIHQLDAAAALLAAGRARNAGKTFYATDGHPMAFEPFMDAFAHRVGRPRPLHLPLRACWPGPSSAKNTCSRPRWPCRLARRCRACPAGDRCSPTTAAVWTRSSRCGANGERSHPTRRGRSRRQVKKAAAPTRLSQSAQNRPAHRNAAPP